MKQINFIPDQNEMSEGSLSVESLLLADQSNSPAEEKTRADSSDTDLEIEDTERSFATIKGAELYLEACKLVGVVPVSYFIRNIEEPYMNLNHHGLGPKGAKAIAITLVSNTTITHLELEDNWILAEGVTCLVQMLRENCYIQELNISNNHIGTEGAEAISRMFLDNISCLRAVQLSGNNFREETAQYFAEALLVSNLAAAEPWATPSPAAMLRSPGSPHPQQQQQQGPRPSHPSSSMTPEHSPPGPRSSSIPWNLPHNSSVCGSAPLPQHLRFSYGVFLIKIMDRSQAMTFWLLPVTCP
ncbi:hypothetical protein UY3_18038 [Chelonia mydas]|uniref:Leucine-rich repeat-containing protein 74A n=1 Tax=Chelonia mydas TaxID=8469 RepID=M7B9K2_CHEMY|nr:hypothetical protein UY3_18038 [Chelonia mydas]